MSRAPKVLLCSPTFRCLTKCQPLWLREEEGEECDAMAAWQITKSTWSCDWFKLKKNFEKFECDTAQNTRDWSVHILNMYINRCLLCLLYYCSTTVVAFWRFCTLLCLFVSRCFCSLFGLLFVSRCNSCKYWISSKSLCQYWRSLKSIVKHKKSRKRLRNWNQRKWHFADVPPSDLFLLNFSNGLLPLSVH